MFFMKVIIPLMEDIVRGCEEEFVEMGIDLDYILSDTYVNDSILSRVGLLLGEERYGRMLEKLINLEKRYRSCFISYETHPDCEIAKDRLERILELINMELYRRDCNS